MKRDLRFERVYPHPPGRVWRALTEAKLLGRWMMHTDFKPEVGHRFTFTTDPGPGFDGVLYCEVLEVDPPNKLVYTFRGGHLKRETTVTWTLVPMPEGTLLRLDHTGFTGLSQIAISAILGTGWRRMFRDLYGVLDDMAGNESGQPSATDKINTQE